MKNIKLSKRYAKALFEFALEKEQVEEVKKDMELICGIAETNSDFCFFLKNPVISSKKKVKVFAAIFENSLNVMSQKYFSIIISKNREKYIPSIASSYIEAYKEYKNIKDVYVETTVVLGATIEAELIAILKEQLYADIHLHQKVNPEIIGGMILMVDDKQIDNSYRNKLNRLRREVAVNEYEISF